MHRSASVTSDGRTPRARLSIGYRHALPPPHRGGGGARSAGGVGATGATTRGRQGGMPGVIPHPESVLHRACPPTFISYSGERNLASSRQATQGADLEYGSTDSRAMEFIVLNDNER